MAEREKEMTTQGYMGSAEKSQ